MFHKKIVTFTPCFEQKTGVFTIDISLNLTDSVVTKKFEALQKIVYGIFPDKKMIELWALF